MNAIEVNTAVLLERINVVFEQVTDEFVFVFSAARAENCVLRDSVIAVVAVESKSDVSAEALFTQSNSALDFSVPHDEDNSASAFFTCNS